MNIIASGKIDQGFSNEQGINLKTDMAKLSTRFNGFLIEHENKLDQIRNEMNNNMQTFMNDTRGVFDAVMKDID